jgi:hypothetical protein
VAAFIIKITHALNHQSSVKHCRSLAVIIVGVTIVAGCGGGAASERTATSHPGATASPALVVTVTFTPLPASPAAEQGSSLTTTTVAATLPVLADQAISPSAAAAVFTSTATVAIGWFPASTTPCQLEGEHHGNRSFATAEQHWRNFRCSVTLFGWPPGKAPDLDRMEPVFFAWVAEQGGAMFEVGYEYTSLTIMNQCAWFMTWLEARKSGDSATEAAALDVMLNIIPNYLTIVPGIPPIHGEDVTNVDREIVTHAAMGDPSLVQAFVDGQNCQEALKYTR